MTQINAYLHFDGNCREAMTFYKDCLGGELTLQPLKARPSRTRCRRRPGEAFCTPRLTTDGFVLMASDMTQSPIVRGNSVSLLHRLQQRGGNQAILRRPFFGREQSPALWESSSGARPSAH